MRLGRRLAEALGAVRARPLRRRLGEVAAKYGSFGQVGVALALGFVIATMVYALGMSWEPT